MQTTRNFISTTAKFPPCMQYGEYHFQCRNTFLMMNTHRNTTSIIFYGYRVILINGNHNFCTIPSQSLVNGIIHNFIYQMMQSFFAGRTNIHTGAFSNRFQPFQHLDLTFIIFYCHFILSLPIMVKNQVFSRLFYDKNSIPFFLYFHKQKALILSAKTIFFLQILFVFTSLILFS